MHVHLRIGDIHIILGECLVNLSVKIIIDIPVIFGSHPSPDQHIHRTIAQGVEGDKNGRFAQDAGIGFEELRKDFLGRLVAVAITDAESPLHPTHSGSGIVDDDVVREISIGHENRPVVAGNQHRIENLYLLHRATLSLRLDKIAHLVGFEDQYHETSGKILQRTAQRHADGNSGRGEKCDKRGGVDTKNANNHHHQYEHQRDVD